MAAEVLYIVWSSSDRRGKRVLVRDSSGCENWLYPESGIDDVTVKLLGLDSGDVKNIRRFFGIDRSYMISTFENIGLQNGDRVLVKVGSSLYRAKVIEASDPSKLRVEFQSGAVLWTGRGSVESILEYVLVEESEWEDFSTVAKERGTAFSYSQEDDGIHVHDNLDAAEDILWAIRVLDAEVGGGGAMP